MKSPGGHEVKQWISTFLQRCPYDAIQRSPKAKEHKENDDQIAEETAKYFNWISQE